MGKIYGLCPNCKEMNVTSDRNRCPLCGTPITFIHGEIELDQYRYSRENN